MIQHAPHIQEESSSSGDSEEEESSDSSSSESDEERKKMTLRMERKTQEIKKLREQLLEKERMLTTNPPAPASPFQPPAGPAVSKGGYSV